MTESLDDEPFTTRIEHPDDFSSLPIGEHVVDHEGRAG